MSIERKGQIIEWLWYIGWLAKGNDLTSVGGFDGKHNEDWAKMADDAIAMLKELPIYHCPDCAYRDCANCKRADPTKPMAFDKSPVSCLTCAKEDCFYHGTDWEAAGKEPMVCGDWKFGKSVKDDPDYHTCPTCQFFDGPIICKGKSGPAIYKKCKQWKPKEEPGEGE